MKFGVDGHVLADAVGWTARALPGRTAVPQLASMLLQVTGDSLRTSAFDYEVSSEATTEVRGEADGTALVSGRLFAEIVRALPDRPVSVSLSGPRLELVCGGGRFTLPTMPVEDYPRLPAMPAHLGRVDAAAFATAVAQVAVTAGRDDTLPVLTGIRCEFERDTLSLVSTDKYRLTLRELAWLPHDADVSTNALVPARTLADIAKGLGQLGGEVGIALARERSGEGIIGFSAGGRSATGRLLEGGSFPPVRRLLPGTATTEARVPVRELTEVARRVALVADRGTPLRLDFEGEGLVIEAYGDDEAHASEAMAATCTGTPMVVAVRPGYLLEALGTLHAPTAVLLFTDPNRPFEVRPADENGTPLPGHRHVMMPLRLSR